MRSTCIALSAIVLAVALADRAAAQASNKPFDVHEKKYVLGQCGTPRIMLKEFSEQTGVPVVGPDPTTGIICVRSRKPTMYSFLEYFDLINEYIQITTKHTLIRTEKEIVVVKVDNLDYKLVPRVSLGELKDRGKTEIVHVVIPVTNGHAVNKVPVLQRLLTEFGKIDADPQSNSLRIWTTARDLQNLQFLFSPGVFSAAWSNKRE